MFLSRVKCTDKLLNGFFVTLCLASLFAPGAAPVQAQNTCATLLKDADQKIYDGLFDEALELVDQCLAQPGLADSTKASALRLKALAFDGKNYVAQAKDTIRELLRLAPEYKADQVQDPPSFRELVEQVRTEVPLTPPQPQTSKKKGGAMKWLLIGGGAAGAVAIAAVLGSGGGNDGGNGVTPPPSALPNPPPLP